ncbi:hypothetical protein PR048_007640 [Dryococelus australis]|uniref:Uncharacterized protein n=1 Tax=Dryococelus australis TaxID=614101 RepID=A0ABQ9HUT6_9NEOP|nr:hypothetical protein PR048_007640 [Dryococelus australis]
MFQWKPILLLLHETPGSAISVSQDWRSARTCSIGTMPIDLPLTQDECDPVDLGLFTFRAIARLDSPLRWQATITPLLKSDRPWFSDMPLQADFSSAGMKGRGKRERPEKTRRPTASSSTIPNCENPVTRPRTEPGSPWWEVGVLIAQPPWPLNFEPGQTCFSAVYGEERSYINVYMPGFALTHRSYFSSKYKWLTKCRRMGSVLYSCRVRRGDRVTRHGSKVQHVDTPRLSGSVQDHDGNTARLARRSDEALGVRVSVARIASSLLDLDLGRRGAVPSCRVPSQPVSQVEAFGKNELWFEGFGKVGSNREHAIVRRAVVAGVQAAAGRGSSCGGWRPTRPRCVRVIAPEVRVARERKSGHIRQLHAAVSAERLEPSIAPASRPSVSQSSVCFFVCQLKAAHNNPSSVNTSVQKSVAHLSSRRKLKFEKRLTYSRIEEKVALRSSEDHVTPPDGRFDPTVASYKRCKETVNRLYHNIKSAVHLFNVARHCYNTHCKDVGRVAYYQQAGPHLNVLTDARRNKVTSPVHLALAPSSLRAVMSAAYTYGTSGCDPIILLVEIRWLSFMRGPELVSQGVKCQRRVQCWPLKAVYMQYRNEMIGETGDPRDNPSTSGIVRHDSHVQKSGGRRPRRGSNPVRLGGRRNVYHVFSLRVIWPDYKTDLATGLTCLRDFYCGFTVLTCFTTLGRDEHAGMQLRHHSGKEARLPGVENCVYQQRGSRTRSHCSEGNYGDHYNTHASCFAIVVLD